MLDRFSPHGSAENLSNTYHRPKNAHRGGAGHNDHGTKPDEPESWTEVGRAKSYSATAEDVGHLLKFEVTSVDAGGAEQSAANGFTTGRVIPAPTPPRRNLVPVAHRDGVGAGEGKESRRGAMRGAGVGVDRGVGDDGAGDGTRANEDAREEVRGGE